MRPLDETNLRLLHNLLQDARLPVAELARRLGRSEATVRERISILEQQGVLRGYRADVDPARLGLGASAIVRAAADLREVPRLRAALAAIPNVVGASVLTGERPIRVRLLARTIRDLELVLKERIAPLGLQDIDTRIVLQELVPARAPDLEAMLLAELNP